MIKYVAYCLIILLNASKMKKKTIFVDRSASLLVGTMRFSKMNFLNHMCSVSLFLTLINYSVIIKWFETLTVLPRELYFSKNTCYLSLY